MEFKIYYVIEQQFKDKKWYPSPSFKYYASEIQADQALRMYKEKGLKVKFRITALTYLNYFKQ